MSATPRLIVGLVTSLLTLTTGCAASASTGNAPPVMPGIAFEQGELYALAPGEAIFSDESFLWYEPPANRVGRAALRTALNREEPITVEVTESGTLYAVLWQWDFGFLPHAPAGAAANLHGWRRVGAGGGAPQHHSGITSMSPRHEERLGPAPQPAPAPFAPLQLYRRDLTPGTHQLPLTDYIGQWVIVGFEADAQVVATTPTAPAVTLSPTQSRHNICDPGVSIAVDAARPIRALKLYRHGRLILQTTDAGFTAPDEPGRYCLEVTFADATRSVPLTVGYGPVDEPGWPRDFFPIHFFTGYGYRGLFRPNPQRLEELSFLSMFELGANTFFTSSDHEFVTALGGRQIVVTSSKTRRWIRTADVTDEQAARFVEYDIRQIMPDAPANVLGLYVDDEPNLEHARRMQGVETLFQDAAGGDRHLIYCLGGWAAPGFWEQAGSTVWMIRSYPIRKSAVTRYAAQIKDELSDPMIQWQPGVRPGRLWLVMQAFGDDQSPNLWNLPRAVHVRLMANLALARGIKGLSYFAHDSSPAAREDLQGVVRWPYVPEDPELHEQIARINAMLREHQDFLSSLRWRESIIQPDDRFDVQILADAAQRLYAWITNPSDEATATGAVQLGAHGTVPIDLAPGEGCLLDLADKTPRWRL